MKKHLFLLLFIPFTAFCQNIEYYNSEEHKKSALPFSQAAVVNGIIYLSGQIGEADSTLVKGGIVPETKQALTNIKNILEEMGHSIDDVFKCTCILSNIEDFQEMSTTYTAFFNRENLPARSSFAGNGLALGAKIEIECFAIYKGAIQH